MRLFSEWFKSEESNSSKPWLVLGKGPSFSRRNEFDLTRYRLFGLNHVPMAVRVDVCHVVDVEVMVQLGDAIYENASFVAVPRYPNWQMKKCAKELSQWFEDIPVLEKLQSENRLLWYDLAGAPQYLSTEKPVIARFFSAEAVIGLLATQGVKQIRTLGIDGGRNYSPAFRAIQSETKLANGQISFDLQFQEFARLINEWDLDLTRLTDDGPVKVFVGASKSEWLPFKVLDYSLKKHASVSVECMQLGDAEIAIPTPRDKANRPRTPFSFHRFLIPELCKHKGKAIYLDSDMLVLRDIRQLWDLPFEGAHLLGIDAADEAQRSSQFAVMLLDCEKLGWRINDIVSKLDSGELDYARLMQKMEVAQKVSNSISHFWNCLDNYHKTASALVHFTDMHKQPWVCRDNPLGWLWVSYLSEAIDAGFISIEDVKREVAIGNIRPSLVRQIQEGIVDPLLIGDAGIVDDLEFRPPYTLMGSQNRILGHIERMLSKLSVSI